MAVHKPWQSDEEFDLLLRQSLSAIQPPADFSNRVMAAVHAAKAEAQPPVVQAPLPRPWRFPLWGRWAAGLGSCAAALLLFWGLSIAPADLSPQRLTTGRPLQTAAVEPQLQRPVNAQAITEPAGPTLNEPAAQSVQPTAPEPTAIDASTATAPEPATPTAPDVTPEPTAPTEPAGPVDTPEPLEIPEESGNGELILPRAAFGTEAQGTLSVRLLASVESSNIYSPTINSRGTAASFYTIDEENVYSWRVDLAAEAATAPEITVITSRSALEDVTTLLANTTAPCEATTLVASPDGTILAQNSADGVWVSLAEGEVYLLTNEGSGQLLAWSPDSSRLLFTNAEGQLFLGYPLEKRIYQIADLTVKDVCWGADNQTIIFLATDQGQDSLYIAELI